MRLSVAFKIFLGFAIVIGAFGTACVYTIYRMSTSQETFTLVWEEVRPIQERLKGLSRRVRSREEVMSFRRPSGPEWAQGLMASLKAPDHMLDVESRLSRVMASPAMEADERRMLGAIRDRLAAFRTGPELGRVIGIEGLDDPDGVLESGTNEAVYGWLVRGTIKRANEGQLVESAPEARAATRMLRQIDRVVVEAVRDLNAPILRIQERGADDDRSARLAGIFVAVGALLASLVMLVSSLATLAPIRQLRESVRRIAAGEYTETVPVRSKDEIGQLAGEFNTMAEALRLRDQELARQREALLRADRLATIGKMAAQITHEVRNPLSSIGLNAELLEEELEALEGSREESVALLGAIQGEVQRLTSITEEYLRYARLPRPEMEPTDLGALVSELVAFIRQEIAGHGIDCTVEGAELGVIALADRDQLRQVLLNVARNAIEALIEGDPPRHLGIAVAYDADHAVVSVSDDGPGIDPDLQGRIFEPFVTGKSGGTGLGLPLTQQIVEGHGGRIEVTSPLDAEGGTRFAIRLPRGSD